MARGQGGQVGTSLVLSPRTRHDKGGTDRDTPLEGCPLSPSGSQTGEKPRLLNAITSTLGLFNAPRVFGALRRNSAIDAGGGIGGTGYFTGGERLSRWKCS